MLVLIAASIALLVACDAEARPLVAPITSAIVIAAWLWSVLWKRDRELPIYDVGALFGFTTLLYTSIPLLGFLAGGLAFTALSDARLVAYSPSPSEIGAFGWKYVAYFAAFAASYLLFREPGTTSSRLDSPGQAATIAVWAWTSLAFGYLLLLWVTTGFSFSASYDDIQAAASLFKSLPLIVQQISHNIAGILQILKLALLVLLYASWNRKWCRRFVCAWIVIEVVASVVTLGSRTPLLLFLVANVLLYHRFVRRFSLGIATVVTATITSFAMLMGFIRSYLGVSDEIGIVAVVTASNEFQSMFGTGYDVAQRYAAGDLRVPWQIYFADIFRLVPQQLLPFEKLDPSQWYLRVIGYEGTGVGFMFGAIAESVISGDWIALGLRGITLGIVFAIAHRWHQRKQHNFYATIAYLWLCLNAYYSLRASTLYLMVWVVYLLLPTLALILLSRELLQMSVGGKRPSSPATN